MRRTSEIAADRPRSEGTAPGARRLLAAAVAAVLVVGLVPTAAVAAPTSVPGTVAPSSTFATAGRLALKGSVTSATVRPGGSTTLKVQYTSHGKNVSKSHVLLQKRKNGRWVDAIEVRVTWGWGKATIRPQGTTTYRLRNHAGTVTSPSFTVQVSGQASSSTTSTKPSTSASKALTPSSGMLFGAAVSKGSARDMDSALAAFESKVGRKLDLHRLYVQWNQASDNADVRATVARGRTPVISISPKRTDGTKASWASIARGDQDARIREHAKDVRSLGVPVFVIFQHEPELATGYGKASEYKGAYRRMVRVFREQGVTNVAWSWVVTPSVFGSSPRVAASTLYPGDDVVDWIGLNVYNWNGCEGSSFTSWRSMSYLAGNFRAFGKKHKKPLMIAEWGTAEDPKSSSRKASWIKDSMATFRSWPEVKAVMYFSTHGSCRWDVDTSSTSLAAFSEVARHSSANRRTSAWLKPSVIHGKAPLTVTFDGSRSTGAGKATGSGIASWTLDLGDGRKRSGTGRPPSSVSRTFPAGTHRARLTVKDSSGRSSTDTVTITVLAAPAVKTEAKDVTATTANLHAFADLHGYPGTVTFEWGRTTSYGNRSKAVAVPAVPYVKTVRHTITGLRPGTLYHVRVTARSSTGTRTATATFGTAGAPTTSRAYASGTTSSTTTFKAQVHAHRLPTTTWFEWGTSPSLGRATSKRSMPTPLTYEKTVSSGQVQKLEPGTTYHFRVVAKNERGTVKGPIQTVRTKR